MIWISQRHTTDCWTFIWEFVCVCACASIHQCLISSGASSVLLAFWYVSAGENTIQTCSFCSEKCSTRFSNCCPTLSVHKASKLSKLQGTFFLSLPMHQKATRPKKIMESLDALMKQFETLVESIAATLREERKVLEDARLQFEKVESQL